MTPYAWLLLLPAAAVAMWVVSRLIRSPRFAVALVPAAAGLANIRVPGVPGDVLVMHLLVAAALGCVLAHRFVYPRDGHPAPSVQRRTVTFLLALFFVVVMMSVRGWRETPSRSDDHHPARRRFLALRPRGGP